MSPQPAATPFTSPIIELLNMMLVQYWQDTNVARENPIMKRTAIYPGADDMNTTEKTTGAVNKLRKGHPYRGPIKSQITPIAILEKMLPDTEATPAFPMSVLVNPRLSRITGTRGAAAKVDMKHVKNEIQAR
ncbi:hypothetical protein Fot_17695 [Forsythia ovata]|uniref:Uncharacterized protein n=1 Tax=Forsythia ovata TaxID=205694 RepID=A0ABD1VG34_9LAMI